MAVIVIHLISEPANLPEPPAPQGGPDAARALHDLRRFEQFATLPAEAQRALWRHKAQLIRDARNTPQPLRAPLDGTAA